MKEKLTDELQDEIDRLQAGLNKAHEEVQPPPGPFPFPLPLLPYKVSLYQTQIFLKVSEVS